MANLFSFHTLIKLVIAVILDIFGFFCTSITLLGLPGAFVGGMLSFFPDILGFVFIGGFDRKKNRNFYLTFMAEVCPKMGALPWWTAYVLFGHKKKNAK
ncbi:MAG: hypothetical protein U9Q96_02695 [Patescibacteria group bacterium]|nr:hypothetical protein [Patescibacteria group bacterium]